VYGNVTTGSQSTILVNPFDDDCDDIITEVVLVKASNVILRGVYHDQQHKPNEVVVDVQFRTRKGKELTNATLGLDESLIRVLHLIKKPKQTLKYSYEKGITAIQCTTATALTSLNADCNVITQFLCTSESSPIVTVMPQHQQQQQDNMGKLILQGIHMLCEATGDQKQFSIPGIKYKQHDIIVYSKNEYFKWVGKAIDEVTKIQYDLKEPKKSSNGAIEHARDGLIQLLKKIGEF